MNPLVAFFLNHPVLPSAGDGVDLHVEVNEGEHGDDAVDEDHANLESKWRNILDLDFNNFICFSANHSVSYIVMVDIDMFYI